MSKHHLSSLRLVLIVTIVVLLGVYWLGMELGYGMVLLIGTVGYTIYLNFKEAKKEKTRDSESYKF